MTQLLHYAPRLEDIALLIDPPHHDQGTIASGRDMRKFAETFTVASTVARQ